MESHDVQTTLTGALGVTGPQLVALVGAGGKTTALQRLCSESATQGGGIIATTTTAMFARQLSSLGPLLVADEDAAPLAARADEALRSAGVVSLARSRIANEKVKGLAPAAVDALWRGGLAGSIFVEADGSRGLPLKAFGVGRASAAVRDHDRRGGRGSGCPRPAARRGPRAPREAAAAAPRRRRGRRS